MILPLLIILAVPSHPDDGLYSPRFSALCAYDRGRELWCLRQPTVEQEALFELVGPRIMKRYGGPWDRRKYLRAVERLRRRLLALSPGYSK